MLIFPFTATQHLETCIEYTGGPRLRRGRAHIPCILFPEKCSSLNRYGINIYRWLIEVTSTLFYANLIITQVGIYFDDSQCHVVAIPVTIVPHAPRRSFRRLRSIPGRSEGSSFLLSVKSSQLFVLADSMKFWSSVRAPTPGVGGMSGREGRKDWHLFM